MEIECRDGECLDGDFLSEELKIVGSKYLLSNLLTLETINYIHTI